MKLKVPETIEMSGGWCPGCGHGIILRVMAEALEELGVSEKTILVKDVACGGMAVNAASFDLIGAAHGRPIITAAGAKRVRPDKLVIAHAGDGSAYSIGIESTIHCALRNENILALIVNNSVFGMTGGQMSPTTLPGQKTTSSPYGRDVETNGRPFDVVKTLKDYDIAYLARGSVTSPAEVLRTGRMIKTALQRQLEGRGFCLVEVLSPCPTNWHLSPEKALTFMQQQERFYPLGIFTDKGGEAK